MPFDTGQVTTMLHLNLLMGNVQEIMRDDIGILRFIIFEQSVDNLAIPPERPNITLVYETKDKESPLKIELT